MRLFSILFIIVMSTALWSADSDTWKPHAHPAYTQRLLTGYTEAIHSLDISAEVSARIIKLPVDVGDIIKADTYIQLDDALARIDVQLALAQEEQTKIQVHVQEQVLAQTNLELDYRAKEKARIENLLEKGVASDEQRDAVVFQYQQAQIAMQQQTAALASAKAASGVATTRAKQSQELLERYRIVLPVGWTISARYAHQHSVAQPSIPLLRLVDTRQLIVRFQLSEQEIKLLKLLDTIKLNLVQHNKTVTVKIKSISPEFDRVSRKREVTLIANANAFPEASGGLTCQLLIRVPDVHGGIHIPRRFINKRFDQLRVQNTAGVWLPILILRYEGDLAVVQASQLPADCQLQVPEIE